MKTDILSEMLRSFHVRSAVFHHLGFSAEWVVETPAMSETKGGIIPGAESMMQFHVISKGSGWACIDGQPPVRLVTGDIVIFPHGHAHRLSNEPHTAAIQFDTEWNKVQVTAVKPTRFPFGDSRSVAHNVPGEESINCLVCGFFSCDGLRFKPFIHSLPRLLHLPAGTETAWIDRAMTQAISASQNRRPGGQAILERVCEMIFVEAIRRHVDGLPKESTGWLTSMHDRLIGAALALIHDQPEKAWTIDLLASEVALSRSAFYDRFIRLVGEPPMQYLTKWRIAVASNLLRKSSQAIASIALDVGYESESAFARAFKRVVGSPPAQWRKRQLTSGSAEAQCVHV
ncbi:MAG: AraC family transcriptional regulator [Pseudomonadota bacterium]